jgi:hypothetical protein
MLDKEVMSQLFAIPEMDEHSNRDTSYLNGRGVFQSLYDTLSLFNEETTSTIPIKEEDIIEEEDREPMKSKLIGMRDSKGTGISKSIIDKDSIHQKTFQMVQKEYLRIRRLSEDNNNSNDFEISPEIELLFYLNYELFSIFNVLAPFQYFKVFDSKWERISYMASHDNGFQQMNHQSLDLSKSELKKRDGNRSVYILGGVDDFLYYHYISLEELILERIEEQKVNEDLRYDPKKPLKRGWKKGIEIDMKKYYDSIGVPEKDRVYPKEYDSSLYLSKRDQEKVEHMTVDIVQSKIGVIMDTLLTDDDTIEIEDSPEIRETDIAYAHLFTEQLLSIVTLYTTFMHYRSVKEKIDFFNEKIEMSEMAKYKEVESILIAQLTDPRNPNYQNEGDEERIIDEESASSSILNIIESRFKQMRRYFNLSDQVTWQSIEVSPTLLIPVGDSIDKFGYPNSKERDPQRVAFDPKQVSTSELPPLATGPVKFTSETEKLIRVVAPQ